MKKALVLSPHTDDGELGCGATISKFLHRDQKDWEVHYAYFTSIIKNSDGTNTNIMEECIESVGELGIGAGCISTHTYEIRNFNSYRQNILDDMIILNKAYNYDMVFMPSSKDIHQDHKVIYEEGLRAFKNTTILGYELPWNNVEFKATCFIDVSETDIQAKCNALSHYKSQTHRRYMDSNYIKSQALFRGVQINKLYAEMFEAIRIIM